MLGIIRNRKIGIVTATSGIVLLGLGSFLLLRNLTNGIASPFSASLDQARITAVDGAPAMRQCARVCARECAENKKGDDALRFCEQACALYYENRDDASNLQALQTLHTVCKDTGQR